ncbi:hypothetical protein [Curtobacterium sp. MCSS17_016]|uniref:hypothetical protein n=1 Tax=Curtobacterium sp. MCSS17_016 TaxID=2175644 RepID=UPI000DA92466|nr:hypothetical protein [Curtobacterium sp. MCSS17_016]WIE81263.1 hypothetical protein DEJ19_018695 [Curtobacterium sp. MCSS17_016]
MTTTISDYQHRILTLAAEHRVFYIPREFTHRIAEWSDAVPNPAPTVFPEVVRSHAMRVLLGRGLVYEAPARTPGSQLLEVKPTERGRDILRADARAAA